MALGVSRQDEEVHLVWHWSIGPFGRDCARVSKRDSEVDHNVVKLIQINNARSIKI